MDFPRKPDKVILMAEFDAPFGDQQYRIRLTKTINGEIAYFAECLTEGLHPEVKALIENTVVADAKKKGVFEPETTK